MLIDTHCHIHDPKYNLDAKATLAAARANGVNQVIVIGTSQKDSSLAQQFAAAHDGVFWSFGIHPEEISDPASTSDPVITTDDKLIAIGEVGLDYHYQPYDRTAQIQLLERMLELAASRHLPLIFHVREAFDDFWPIIDNAHVKNAVLHSFSDNQANLEAALARGFYIGVNGLATFAPIPLPPLERMLLETDAPYLTPPPFRGKINQPSYVKYIAEWVARELGTSLEAVARQTTANATTLFNL